MEKIERGIAWLGKKVADGSSGIEGQLKLLREEVEAQTKQLRQLNQNLERILAHVSSVDGSVIQSEQYLKQIEGSSFLTQMEVIRWRRGIEDET